ncbi:hypothetical protein ACOJBM_02080 [Rhizobium beringeri]|uniref:Uncharacterized protein n=1 Tax=Rhizobium leguminosarum TaxID=384 RepID=A0A1L3ZMC8_RHILE|nr:MULTISPECIES: hypothetical protein [Rhizobium]API56794.1 hypothetical protein BMW22_35890 [Rhizobium leguminosarum]
MSEIPPLQKSRRSLSDLDSLIADSIGKMGSYGEMHGSPKSGQRSSEPPSAEPQPQPTDPDTGSIDDKPERFQISLSGAVIIAAKLEALKQKTTAGEITERALRSYLGMLPRA